MSLPPLRKNAGRVARADRPQIASDEERISIHLLAIRKQERP